MSNPAPTMEDVARAAGVHQTTVSRALRNDRRLSSATRERVQQVARELGYRPHPLLAALGANLRRRHTTDYHASVAFVMRADTLRQRRREHLAGATEAAEAQGYRLEEFVLGEAGVPGPRLDEILRARNVHGVVVAPLSLAHGNYDLSWTQFCNVAIEYTFTSPMFDRVVHDSYGAMRLVVQQCRERGFRRLGLVLTTSGHERTEGNNVAAYWLEQKEPSNELADIPPLLLPQWNLDQFQAWFDAHRPQVILTSNWLLDQIQDFARQRQLAIPDNLSLVNLNAMPANTVTGIVQNNHAIGALAVQLLIDKIKRNDRGVPSLRQTILIPGSWMEGETLRSSAP